MLSVTFGIPYQEVRAWPSWVISLYMAYYRVEPFGEQRADLRNAMWLAQHAEMHRDKTKRAEPFSAADFMPFAERDESAHQMTLRSKAAQLFGRRK